MVAAYGLILPKPILAAPRLGCLNVHGSLLPRWRGAAPIERAILAGDTETGVTIMQMEAGLDTGPMLLIAARRRSSPTTTATALHRRLADLGAALLLPALDGVAAGDADRGAAAGRRRHLRQEAGARRRPDRLAPAGGRAGAGGARPQPGAGRLVRTRRRAHQGAGGGGDGEGRRGAGAPGEVLDDRLAVACGSGALRPLVLQRPGRGPTELAAFLRGYPLPAGTVLA